MNIKINSMNAAYLPTSTTFTTLKSIYFLIASKISSKNLIVALEC
jgi:hypothetical protein